MEKERIVSYQRILKGENVQTRLLAHQLSLDNYSEENDIEFAENYVDIEETATDDRPNYNRLMQDIAEGNIDKLVVLGSVDRLSKEKSVIDKISKEVEIILIEVDKITNLKYNTSYYTKFINILEPMQRRD